MDDLGDAVEPNLDLKALQHLFADDESAQAPKHSDTHPELPEVCVFDSKRSQNIAIVLRGVFRQIPSMEEMEALAAGLEEVEPSYGGSSAVHLRDADNLVLLATALPTADEAGALLAACPARLRHIERLVVPLANVSHIAERLRALRLSAQAAGVHDVLVRRMSAVSSASKALRDSGALRSLLHTVARLGSWINSADLKSEPGFALSSALGKLRQFRAYRQDRGLSLLHVTVLAAVGGQSSRVGHLAMELDDELKTLLGIEREDLQELGSGVSDFAADAAWISKESEEPDSSGICEGHRYPLAVRVRMRAIHQEELQNRSKPLADAWDALLAELQTMIAFFAESEGICIELTSQQLLRTVETFRREVQQAVREISEEPERFMQAYTAKMGQPPEAGTSRPRPRPKPRARSNIVSAARSSGARELARPSSQLGQAEGSRLNGHAIPGTNLRSGS